jgi:hypothetical protein
MTSWLSLPQVVYASGANGIAGDDPSTLAEDLEPLFECIVREVAPPSVRLEAPLQLLVTNLDCASLTFWQMPASGGVWDTCTICSSCAAHLLTCSAIVAPPLKMVCRT